MDVYNQIPAAVVSQQGRSSLADRVSVLASFSFQHPWCCYTSYRQLPSWAMCSFRPGTGVAHDPLFYSWYHSVFHSTGKCVHHADKRSSCSCEHSSCSFGNPWVWGRQAHLFPMMLIARSNPRAKTTPLPFPKPCSEWILANWWGSAAIGSRVGRLRLAVVYPTSVCPLKIFIGWFNSEVWYFNL